MINKIFYSFIAQSLRENIPPIVLNFVIQSLVNKMSSSNSLNSFKAITPDFFNGRRLSIGMNTLVTIFVVYRVARLFFSLEPFNDKKRKTQDLTKLDLSSRDLLILPDMMEKYKNLKKLNLSRNKLKTLPPSIKNLKYLEKLKIWKNKFKIFPNEIVELENLVKLDLSVNKLKTLSPLIKKLKNLKELRLGCNRFEIFPVVIVELENLVKLDLSGNELKTLPFSIKKLNNLKKFELWRNQFEIFPEALLELENLTKLGFGNNKLRILPNSIERLKDLQKLCLSGNQLEEIPFEIWKLQNLETLELGDNQLLTLPFSIEKLKNLKELYLFKNRFQILLPEVIWKLKNLQGLDLSNNLLQTVSEEIWKLKKLEWIDLSYNRLSTLPPLVEELRSLRSLKLQYNQFADLPDSLFANLPSSCMIDAEYNQFTGERIRHFENRTLEIRRGNRNRGPGFTMNIYEERVEAQPLEQELIFWLQEYQTLFPGSSKDHPDYFPSSTDPKNCPAFYQPLLSHHQNKQLSLFLARLKITQDYIDGGAKRNNIFSKVQPMLAQASVDERFREALFVILPSAIEDCGDAIIDAFDTVEIHYRLSQTNNSLEELAQILIGMERRDLSRQKAAKRARELNRADLYEVERYYEIKLKDELRLPTSTSSMIYKTYGEVPLDMLTEDKKAILKVTTGIDKVLLILMKSTFWKNRIRPFLAPELEKINTEIAEEIENICKNDDLSEQARLDRIAALKTKGQKKELESINNYTKTWTENSSL